MLAHFDIHCLNYQKESNKLVDEHIKYIKKNFNVYPAGVGGGMASEINRISLHSDCYKIVNVDQAREIFFDCVSDLLNRFNCCPKIRPYMHNFPFTIDNLHLILAFSTSEGKRPPEPNVALITVGNGKVFYAEYKHGLRDFNDIHIESIEKAFETYHLNKLSKQL